MASLYDYAGWLLPTDDPHVTIPRDPRPSISGGPLGREGTLYFRVRLESLGDFLTFAGGQVETVPYIGGTIERRVPLRHPDDPFMFIDSYTAEPFGNPRKNTWSEGLSIHTEQFSHWMVRAIFRTLPEGVGGNLGTYYTVSTQTSASHETVPSEGMETDDGEDLTGEVGIPIPTMSMVITTFMAPNPVGYAINSLVGRVNSVDLDLGIFGTYPAGTMRFDGVDQDITVTSSGGFLSKRFMLKYRPMLWNQVFSRDGTPVLARSKGLGLRKYGTSDLNILKAAWGPEAAPVSELVLDDIDFGDGTLNAVWRALREATERANRWTVDGAAALDEGPTGFALHVRRSRGEGQHAVVLSPGISAASGPDQLGSGPVQLRNADATGALTDGGTGICWINFTTPIAAGTRITMVPFRGDWTIPGANCPPASPWGPNHGESSPFPV
jgi:hypothetical protein